MRHGLLLLLLGILLPLPAQRTLPSRAELQAVEGSFDQKLKRASLESPMEVFGPTRGVYVEGAGAVFSTEVNLIPTVGISPFRPTISKEEVAQVRAAKLKRIPILKGLMREMMVASAGSLDRVPMDEQIVFGVNLFYGSWEDRAGLPLQILMRAQRKALLEVAANRAPASTLDTIVKVREE